MRIALATNPEYAIEVYQPGVGLERVIRLSGARRRPSDAERAGIRTWIARSESHEKDPAIIDRLVAAVPTPDSLPAIDRLAIAPGGEIFATRGGCMLAMRVCESDDFDSKGIYLGLIRLPTRFVTLEIGRDYVLGARYDAEDVPFIEVYRLQKPR
jgi:hypothetical protein